MTKESVSLCIIVLSYFVMPVNSFAVDTPEVAAMLQKYKVTFDCKKASNFAEQTACTNTKVSQLDGLLLSTYQSRSSSRFGQNQNELRQKQRDWIAKRNKCSNAECVEKEYRARIIELCEIDTVVSGVYPISDCDTFSDQK